MSPTSPHTSSGSRARAAPTRLAPACFCCLTRLAGSTRARDGSLTVSPSSARASSSFLISTAAQPAGRAPRRALPSTRGRAGFHPPASRPTLVSAPTRAHARRPACGANGAGRARARRAVRSRRDLARRRTPRLGRRRHLPTRRRHGWAAGAKGAAALRLWRRRHRRRPRSTRAARGGGRGGGTNGCSHCVCAPAAAAAAAVGRASDSAAAKRGELLAGRLAAGRLAASRCCPASRCCLLGEVDPEEGHALLRTLPTLRQRKNRCPLRRCCPLRQRK